ncbi:MAG: hypothetical protein AAFO62_02435, partial [Pseudomonadota bacterium]
MITIEALIFGVLGFLIAGTLAVLFAPVFWARAVRLTTEDLKRSIPMTEEEIAAERGLLKAKHAIELNALTTELDTLKRATAVGRVDVNRRDARIADLERQIGDLTSEREANSNARRVLERTLTERVPQAERELRAAQSELRARDDELAGLREKADKALLALDEAIQLNETQRTEIESQQGRLALRLAAEDGAQRPDSRKAASTEAELTRLRSRVREQATLISSLQQAEKQRLDATAKKGAASSAITVGATEPSRDDVDTTAAPNLLALRADLKRLQGQIEDRDREIKGLKAEIAAFTDAHSTAPAAGSNEATRTRSITADRARLASLETLTGDQEKTIGRLRSDLTAANERLVRQAAHFMDELKRLGSAPAAAQQLASRPDQEPARKSRRSSSLTQRIRETIVQADATEGSGEVGTRERSQERSAVPAPTARAPELSLKDTPAPAASPAPSQTANGNGATPSPDARTTGNGKSN